MNNYEQVLHQQKELLPHTASKNMYYVLCCTREMFYSILKDRGLYSTIELQQAVEKQLWQSTSTSLTTDYGTLRVLFVDSEGELTVSVARKKQ